MLKLPSGLPNRLTSMQPNSSVIPCSNDELLPAALPNCDLDALPLNALSRLDKARNFWNGILVLERFAAALQTLEQVQNEWAIVIGRQVSPAPLMQRMFKAVISDANVRNGGTHCPTATSHLGW